VSTHPPGRHRAPAKSPATAFGQLAGAVGGTAGAAAKTGAVLAVSGGLVAALGLQANAAPNVPASGSVRSAVPATSAFPASDVPASDVPVTEPVGRSLAQQLHVADRPTDRDRTIADRSEQAAAAARLAAERARAAKRDEAKREQAAREQAERDQASREQAKRKRAEREHAEHDQRERAAKRERAKERQQAQERDRAHHRNRAERRERSSRSAERSSRHSDSPARAGAPGSRSFGEAVLGIAARYEGIMYVYGGTTPAGFDCSGYTSYVMRKVGISLPRTSGAQRAATRRVSRGDAVPGDLVFMPGHVGIYAGNGRMWDAPRTGKAISKRTIWSGSATFGRVS
jgi:peptidoglycan DL-endopeptidase CwlO